MNRPPAELCRRLQYDFADAGLLERALTHRSKSERNYERLEFLGDSVLSFVVSADLFERYPALAEGELTRLRASLVRQQTLAELARGLALGDYLELGSGELKSGGFDRDSILADTLEAVFGAIYRDGGLASAQRVILGLYAEALAALDPRSIPKDPKTQLQEYLQKHSLPLPSYHILEVAGEPHSQKFVVECHVAGLPAPVRGEGAGRRRAEQQAAAAAYEQLTRRG
ncbi:MAG: ribonuclease III [Candidatus Muproteobacteria bacterium RBG_16_64_10]|uniref:Ribonuclease 3 n=1 Tax=Candidatus Muproteobacteria bacterium RBG_16_64_10 TaxID=1817757 RepID=A0A1F6T344_9PROT|nr:MAG: ribonuclease III [Candidatus Muproteobacteria bacterium RBG_16_64_10]